MLMRPFFFEYRVWGVGWAAMKIAEGEVSREMTISYIGPDINDLVDALADLLSGECHEATIKFDGEEDQHVWSLTHAGRDICLRVTSSVQLPKESDDDFEYDDWQHEFTIPVVRFVNEIVNAFEAIATGVGEEEYQRRWHRGLSAAVRVQELRELTSRRTSGSDAHKT